MPLLWVLMVASATMEAAMYAFVLEWTPAVSSTAGELRTRPTTRLFAHTLHILVVARWQR